MFCWPILPQVTISIQIITTCFMYQTWIFKQKSCWHVFTFRLAAWVWRTGHWISIISSWFYRLFIKLVIYALMFIRKASELRWIKISFTKAYTNQTTYKVNPRCVGSKFHLYFTLCPFLNAATVQQKGPFLYLMAGFQTIWNLESKNR